MRNMIKTYATYSFLSGRVYEQDRLVEFIRDLPLGGIINILSHLGFSLNLSENKNIRRGFIECVKAYDLHKMLDIDRLEGRVLYSRQGLLTLWKWLFAYGDRNKLDKPVEIAQGVNIVIYLCLIISDYLYLDDKQNTKYEFLRNIAFNSSPPDPRLSLARSRFIYKELVPDRELYDSGEYLDINEDFLNHYGYTIDEYLSIYFGLWATFVGRDGALSGSAQGIVLADIFSKTALSEKAKYVTGPLLLDFDSAHKWSLDKIDEPWDFTLFCNKPLFSRTDGSIYPISLGLLYGPMFMRLYYQARKCYCMDDTRFQAFFGRPFELYVGRIMEHVVGTARIPYDYIKEFKYTYDGSEARSPDVMVGLDDRLLAIEVKATTMSAKTQVQGDPTSTEHDMERMVINPMKQLHDRLEEICASLPPEMPNLSSIRGFYLMVVTMGRSPAFGPFLDTAEDELGGYFSLPVKGFYHLGIEEFEMLAHIIGRKKGAPIFRILDNKSKNYPHHPFKNFINESSLPVKRPKFLDDQTWKQVDEMQELLFPDTTLSLPAKVFV